MRPKKDGEFVNTKLERTLAYRFNKYVAEAGLPKTVVVENILKMYLDKNASVERDNKQ